MPQDNKPEMRPQAREYLAIVHKNDVLKVLQQVMVLKIERVELDGMNHIQMSDLYRLLKEYHSALNKL